MRGEIWLAVLPELAVTLVYQLKGPGMRTKAGGFHYAHLPPKHSGVQCQQFPASACNHLSGLVLSLPFPPLGSPPPGGSQLC